MKKALFLYNPLAGDHSVSGRLNHIIGMFQDRDVLLQPYRISGDEGTDRVVKLLGGGDYSYVVAAGGDGTLNLVANLLLKNSIDLPLGIIPAGTSNDFAGCLGLPASHEECIELILSGHILETDICLVNENTYFLSTCAGGMFADVSFNTNHDLKKTFGPFAYYLQALSAIAGISAFNLEIHTDEAVIQEEALLFLVLNGKRGAGFSNLAKEATLYDGLMDIILIKNCTPMDLAAIILKALTNDTMEDKNIILARTKACLIKGSSSILLSIDGERGPSLPLSIKLADKSLRVFAKKREA